MKTKLYVVLGILVIILSYSFRKNNIANTEKNYLPINKDLKITGSELFQKNCAACHGLQLQGNPPAFPSLVMVNQKLSKNQISELLITGRNVMPSFSHLSNSERVAIVGYLYGEFTETEIVTEVTSIENGKNLFLANCASCHELNKTNNSKLNTNPNGNWGMQPPNIEGINKVYNLNQFKQIVNLGPCYMPSFSLMEDNAKEDIYAYLSSFESSYQNSNYRTRRSSSCGMRMR
jgi:mono/diheme cytochrome c family protein